jgi:NADH-quinone oxidoreductase subunit A
MAFFEISIIILLIISLLYIVSFIISISSKDFEKFSPYECGFEPIHSNARLKFDILYWIIGILYLIFDLELIFIFPLATILND